MLSVPCPCGLVHMKRPEVRCEILERVLRGNEKAPTLEGRGAAHRLTVTRWGTWGHYSPRPSRVGAEMANPPDRADALAGPCYWAK